MPYETARLNDFQSGCNVVVHPGTVHKYEAFLPNLVCKVWSWDDPEINVLLSNANLALGMLESFARRIPNIEVYLKTHVRVEANKSSRIEGTRTTLEEDLLAYDNVAPEKRDDWQEVQNYISAMNYGIEQVMSSSGLPLCNRLLREIHARLLRGARGAYKTPGEFRRSQNWIGGANVLSAVYVPPPENALPELLDDLERLITDDESPVPSLIVCAIFHYQFETVHPFLDGNGRIGRLAIPLYLLSKRVLTTPCFYISDYFERNRVEYYDALQRARVKSDMIGWVKFFLRAARSAAESGIHKFEKAIALFDEYRARLDGFHVRNTDSFRKALEAFYAKPSLEPSELVAVTGLSASSVYPILDRLHQEGMIKEMTGYSRNKVFQMTRYLDCFRDE